MHEFGRLKRLPPGAALGAGPGAEGEDGGEGEDEGGEEQGQERNGGEGTERGHGRAEVRPPENQSGKADGGGSGGSEYPRRARPARAERGGVRAHFDRLRDPVHSSGAQGD